jgi:hypothetical protein
MSKRKTKDQAATPATTIEQRILERQRQNMRRALLKRRRQKSGQ